MKNLKTTLISFLKENVETLDKWKEMMDKLDLKLYTDFQTTNKADIEQMRENYKAIRRNALQRLNKELNATGKQGTLLGMDVSDDELYPYVDVKHQTTFFRYSRILDFYDGYKPKNIIVIKKKA